MAMLLGGIVVFAVISAVVVVVIVVVIVLILVEPMRVLWLLLLLFRFGTAAREHNSFLSSLWGIQLYATETETLTPTATATAAAAVAAMETETETEKMSVFPRTIFRHECLYTRVCTHQPTYTRTLPPAIHIVYTIVFGQLRTKVSLALQHQQANTSREQRHRTRKPGSSTRIQDAPLTTVQLVDFDTRMQKTYPCNEMFYVAPGELKSGSDVACQCSVSTRHFPIVAI